jgi:hypothetical protein
MNGSSKSSPGSPPAKAPSPTPSPPPPAASKPASFDEARLRALFSGLSPDEISRSWNAGLAMAAVSLAMRERLIDPPENPAPETKR